MNISLSARVKGRGTGAFARQARRWACAVGCGLLLGSAALADSPATARIDAQIAANAGKTGVYVLETGEEALLARAWLVDQARESIEVQYFIWSTDNIGILAAEALLRAADRGVPVRVIVDDLMIDAPDKSLSRWPAIRKSTSGSTTRKPRSAFRCKNACST